MTRIIYLQIVSLTLVQRGVAPPGLIKHTSSIGKPNGGVPQGTVSGPRYFIMYINDLTTLAPMYKYVDDSTIFEICSGNVVSTIQQSIDDVVKWTDDNDMRLNCDKCK